MNNIENKDSDINIDMISIYKMSFIYNSILNGWTVRKLENNKFEFSNKSEELKKEFHLDNFHRIFVKSNLNINQLINGNLLKEDSKLLS